MDKAEDGCEKSGRQVRGKARPDYRVLFNGRVGEEWWQRSWELDPCKADKRRSSIEGQVGDKRRQAETSGCKQGRNQYITSKQQVRAHIQPGDKIMLSQEGTWKKQTRRWSDRITSSQKRILSKRIRPAKASRLRKNVSEEKPFALCQGWDTCSQSDRDGR